jgi:hypothetical protein
MDTELLDQIPIWCFFLLAITIPMVAVEIGYRCRHWRDRRRSNEPEAPIATMVGSILGLLAFMLAFTFGLAATRFDARRQAVLAEANAIGTTYLRAQLLLEPERSTTTNLLREYTELRAKIGKNISIPDLLTKSDEIHKQLWSQAVAAAQKDPHSITTGLFLESLNETIDLHSERVFVGLRSRIPMAIWLSLWCLTLIGMFSVGYQAGSPGARRSLEMCVFSLAFAVVLVLIVDLDRNRDGFLEVSQQSIIDVLNTMQDTKD